jgi:N-methylhydantoinase A
MWWIGIDVGGTFTDGVAYDDEGQSFLYAKSPSTPGDPTQGVLDVIDRLAVDMSKVERFVHGLTIGTNAILQGRGADCWMLVTRGFRDVLEIGRTNRPVLYNIKTLKQPPIIPRTRSLEVDERLLFDGTARRPLDEDSVLAAVGRLRQAGETGAVAICFLHSYANPTHEERTREIVERELPGWYVSTSSEVLPQFREYERFNTTALNTYIGPLISRYLDRLTEGLKSKGYKRSVFVTTSNGGVSTATRARRLPISTVLSGPAGGVAAAVHLGRHVGIRNMITCDMGGTSTDVCLIEDLEVPVTNEQFIGGYANRTPQIAINAVGAGGGSIAWIDAGDILKVGPQSAGASPGPVCYGQGGTEPTVTDANLLMNRLDAKHPLAGRIALDKDLALSAMTALGERLSGIGPYELAEGVIRIAVARMVSAIKQISVSNGYDPRDFTLVPFGGAGPMHAAAIADELEMRSVLIPVSPGNFCAFGSLISDIRRDLVLTRTIQVRNTSFAEIDAIFARLEETGRDALIAEGVPPASIELRRSVGMRYLGQSWELPVDVGSDVRDLAEIEAAFAEVHDRRFGHKADDATEIVNFRVAAIGVVGKPDLPHWTTKGDLAGARTGTREVYFGGRFMETAIYDRARLPVGQTIQGPAIVNEDGATTILPPEWRATVLAHGDLLMERSA